MDYQLEDIFYVFYNQWYTDAALYVKKYQLMGYEGYEEKNYFYPNDKITRAQLCTVLYEFSYVNNFDPELIEVSEKVYNRVNDENISSYEAKFSIAWALSHKIICGTDKGIEPDGYVTRAQLAVILKAYSKANSVIVSRDDYYIAPAMKPVVYLYPEKKTDVSVKLDLNGELTCSYPEYGSGWNVTAMPDGTLYDEENQQYSYLYWEGELNTVYDLSKGFCVKGKDTAAFLEKALAKLGLTREESNEFIVYWLPQMQDNEYNIISFQTDAYTDCAKLDIDPEPDTIIRVFMAYRASDEYVDIPAQKLSAPDRNGFTVVEWGGAEVK